MGSGNVFALNIALHQGVLKLQSDRWHQSTLFGQRHGACDVPGGYIGEAVVANLARAHQRAQRLDNLLHRRDHVPHMHPVEVDVIGAQPAQRALKRAIGVLATIAARVGIGFLRREGELRRQHKLVTQLRFGDEAAHDFFTFAVGVHVGAVEKVSAVFDIAVKDAT